MSGRRILVLHGHPDPESYCRALGTAYADAARGAGAEVREIVIADLEFDPNLRFGYRRRTELEPDLLAAQDSIRWAEHLVWVHPVWWGSYPALMKGFIDRTLLPGFAFQKREDSLWWDRHLTGRTGRIVTTMDQPPWYYRMRYGAPSVRALREVTLDFVGIRRVRTTQIGPVRNSTAAFRAKHLDRIKALGTREARG